MDTFIIFPMRSNLAAEMQDLSGEPNLTNIKEIEVFYSQRLEYSYCKI